LADAGRQWKEQQEGSDRFIRLFRTVGTETTSQRGSLDGSLLGAARRFHQWDGKNTAELGKFTHCIVDAKRLLVSP
jgi:hypothetical protein